MADEGELDAQVLLLQFIELADEGKVFEAQRVRKILHKEIARLQRVERDMKIREGVQTRLANAAPQPWPRVKQIHRRTGLRAYIKPHIERLKVADIGHVELVRATPLYGLDDLQVGLASACFDLIGRQKCQTHRTVDGIEVTRVA